MRSLICNEYTRMADTIEPETYNHLIELHIRAVGSVGAWEAEIRATAGRGDYFEISTRIESLRETADRLAGALAELDQIDEHDVYESLDAEMAAGLLATHDLIRDAHRVAADGVFVLEAAL